MKMSNIAQSRAMLRGADNELLNEGLYVRRFQSYIRMQLGIAAGVPQENGPNVS
jgi:hypothetical protein